jgi:uncharacterized protein YbgA (DUF1722 family)/uncharacterized protein YbbK (DUF523 family)
MTTAQRSSPVRIGISSCLLGNRVRYDGGHKLDPFLAQTLGAFVEYVPVCPEVEAGFPVPREAFRLVGDPESPRLVTQKTGVDVTGRMQAWAASRLDELARLGLCGFVFKANSPSSGMERVKVYNETGVALRKGTGLFAAAFMKRFPLLPVEEEGRLHDMALRENFVERIFVQSRWHDLLAAGAGGGALVEFHARHKLLLMAHSPELMRQLGRQVADAGRKPAPAVLSEYHRHLMSALALRATARKQVNVLQHIMGYFKKSLEGDDKQEMLQVIGDYHRGLVPLVVPLTLLNHYVRRFGPDYLRQQVYLQPHPVELMLRNHV